MAVSRSLIVALMTGAETMADSVPPHSPFLRCRTAEAALSSEEGAASAGAWARPRSATVWRAPGKKWYQTTAAAARMKRHKRACFHQDIRFSGSWPSKRPNQARALLQAAGCRVLCTRFVRLDLAWFPQLYH